jgi:hypothetical protein
MRWGAVLRRLLTPLTDTFADAFREINDLATLHGAVAIVGGVQGTSRCYPFAAVGVCCDRPGSQSQLRRPTR